MGNGFLTSSPASRHGDSIQATVQGFVAQKFTCPGTGTLSISEIGAWIQADALTTAAFHLAIFGDDPVNGCPSTIIADSDTGELTHNTTTLTKKSFSYSTKPQVTAGTDYWLVVMFADSNGNIDLFTTGGTSVSKTWSTYPTWPTDTQWHSNTARTWDVGIYAVYSGAYSIAAGGGSYALTGKAATLRPTLKLPAAPGSYSLSGKAATLKFGGKLSALPGSYLLTGKSSTLKAILKLALGSGSYSLTGKPATLIVGQHYRLSVEGGYYCEPDEKVFLTLDGRLYKKKGSTYLRLA